MCVHPVTWRVLPLYYVSLVNIKLDHKYSYNVAADFTTMKSDDEYM